jgi:Xaa-Pro aminopeptidase
MHPRHWLPFLTLFALTALALAHGQGAAIYYQTNFPPEEFRARWDKVFDKIGNQAVAVVQGMPAVNGFIYPRQHNEFYYLCGVDTPHAYIVLDGQHRKVTLYMPPRNQQQESAEGRILSAADGDLLKKWVGVDEVMSTADMREDKMTAFKTAKTIYTPLQPAEGYAQSRGELRAANRAIAEDYWDGRDSRETNFKNLLAKRFPEKEIKDLCPVLNDLRGIKSPREIAMIRRASQLAGLGMMEAMRSTKPGVYEYQLEGVARYEYIINGARLDGYRSIIGAGTANISNMHYFRNTSEIQNGDLILMDYAPDYGCYVSDIGRVWPANGKYAPWQRELLQVVLDYRNAIMKRIRPGVTTSVIRAEAREAMKPILEKTKFSKPIYKTAAEKLVAQGGGEFSHTVGMAVHDDGFYNDRAGTNALKVGQVFSIDPALRVPEENLYLRFEDVVVVTETGVENFTDFLPSELNDIEKLVGKGGMLQAYPPTPENKIKHPK